MPSDRTEERICKYRKCNKPFMTRPNAKQQYCCNKHSAEERRAQRWDSGTHENNELFPHVKPLKNEGGYERVFSQEAQDGARSNVTA